MPYHQPSPTSYADINAVLGMLSSGAQTILGDCFLGLYLCGSLASGHFDPGSSDIDFLIVTTAELAEDVVSALASMHGRLAADSNRWAKELDGDYIPAGALRRHDPGRSRYPHLGWGETLRVEGHGSDMIFTRHVLREWGVTVAGPPPCTLIDPVSPDELRWAARGLAREWWVPAIDDPARLRDPHHLIYAVLTMCRLLYTVEHGAVVPKPVAAAWAQQASEPCWRALITRAASRQLQQADCEETRSFLQYTLARIL